MEVEPEPKLWIKKEPEPKKNNFGSATLQGFSVRRMATLFLTFGNVFCIKETSELTAFYALFKL